MKFILFCNLDFFSPFKQQWSQSFQSMIKLCLQKIPKQRPNCEELLQHEHFQPLSDLNVRNEYQSRIKAQICDQIDNVGTSSKDAADGGYAMNYCLCLYALYLWNLFRLTT